MFIFIKNGQKGTELITRDSSMSRRHRRLWSLVLPMETRRFDNFYPERFTNELDKASKTIFLKICFDIFVIVLFLTV